MPYHYALRTQKDFVIGRENHKHYLLPVALGNWVKGRLELSTDIPLLSGIFFPGSV